MLVVVGTELEPVLVVAVVLLELGLVVVVVLLEPSLVVVVLPLEKLGVADEAVVEDVDDEVALDVDVDKDVDPTQKGGPRTAIGSHPASRVVGVANANSGGNYQGHGKRCRKAKATRDLSVGIRCRPVVYGACSRPMVRNQAKFGGHHIGHAAPKRAVVIVGGGTRLSERVCSG